MGMGLCGDLVNATVSSLKSKTVQDPLAGADASCQSRLRFPDFHSPTCQSFFGFLTKLESRAHIVDFVHLCCICRIRHCLVKDEKDKMMDVVQYVSLLYWNRHKISKQMNVRVLHSQFTCFFISFLFFSFLFCYPYCDWWNIPASRITTIVVLC